MRIIENITKNLIDAIHSSEEYQSYEHFKNIIDNDLEAKNKINDFKHMQVEMYLKQNIAENEKENLQNMYSELMLDENIDSYLNYEMRLFKTITRIYDEIVNSVDIDLDFMNN